MLSSVIHMLNQVVDIKDIKKRYNKSTLFLENKRGSMKGVHSNFSNFYQNGHQGDKDVAVQH